MIEEYVFHLKKMGKSPNTISIYQKHIQSFFDDLNIKPERVVTPDDVRDWINKLVDTEDGKFVSIKPINDQIIIIRNFYSWAQENNKLQYNPMEEIETLKLLDDEYGKIVLLTKEEFKSVLNQIKMQTLQLEIKEVDRKEKYLRDRTIIYLLTYAGLRLKELTKLRLTDIDMELRCISISETKGKCRIVPIYDKLSNELKTWLEYRKAMSKKKTIVNDSPFLFYGHRSLRLEVLYIERFLRKYSLPNKHLTPKMLRHTFCKWMLKETNNDVKTVCKWAGHSDISVTERYLRET